MKMMKLMVAAVSAVVLSGCGGSICDRLESQSKELPKKVAACPTLAALVNNASGTAFNKAQCETDVKDKCSEADKKLIEEFLTCVEKLEVCAASTESAYFLSFASCGAKLQNLTTSCSASSSF